MNNMGPFNGLGSVKTHNHKKIQWAEYERWKLQFTADALRGLRYGQSFCNYFGITDNLLFFTQDPEWCDKYIWDRYLARG